VNSRAKARPCEQPCESAPDRKNQNFYALKYNDDGALEWVCAQTRSMSENHFTQAGAGLRDEIARQTKTGGP
jgi:hypothetical protein